MKNKILVTSIITLLSLPALAMDSKTSDGKTSHDVTTMEMKTTGNLSSFADMDSDNNGSLSRSEYEASLSSHHRMSGSSAGAYVSPAHALNETDGMLDEAGQKWAPKAGANDKPYRSEAHASNQTDGMLRMGGAAVTNPSAHDNTGASSDMSSNADTDDSEGVTSNNPLTEQHIP